MLILFDVVPVLRDLAASLCKVIYPLIGWLFELFMNIANVRLLSQADIKPIYARVTLIITIIMVFYVTFEFVKYVIQPDQMTDKEKGAGKVVYRLLMVVLLIAFVPKIFDLSYDVQEALLERQVISKIILGKSTESQANQGRAFSANMFQMFYKIDERFWESAGKSIDNLKCGNVLCRTIVQVNISTLASDGSLNYIHEKLNDTEKVSANGLEKQKVYKITFNGLLAVVVGVFMAYILIIYCIDLGVRVIQMAYLQVIAPIPIIGYLSPKKDNIFSKWLKQCTATYIDLFMRLAVMHFALLIAEIITNAYNSGTLVNTDAAGDIKTFTYVALILGLLLFMKKFPELIKELFPKLSAASGNLGLKAGDRVAPLAARALGAGLAGARGLVAGGIRRAAHARARNKANGWAVGFERFTAEGRAKNKAKREEMRENKAELRASKHRNRTARKDKATADEYNEAKNAWNEKVANNGELNSLKRKIKDAKERGDDVEAKRLGKEYAAKYKELRETSSEGKRFKGAEKAYVSSSSVDYERNQRSKERDKMKAADERVSAATKNLNESEKKYKDALATGDHERIMNAKAQRDMDKSELSAAEAEKKKIQDKIDTNSEQLKSVFQTPTDERQEQLDNKLDTAQEQVIKDKNNHYQGLGGVVGGTAAGTVQMAWEAGKSTTKFEDIGKNVKQAAQHDQQRVKAQQQYYDNGGTGWVNRTVQQVEKSIGVPTAYERTMLEQQTYEPKIKNLDAMSTVTKDVKATADSAEDRLKDKIGELNLIAEGAEIKTGLPGTEGKYTVQPGETLAQVYQKFKGRATKAKTESEEATKRLEEFRAKNPTDTAGIAALEKVADDKATAAANAEFAVTQVQKNAARHEFSKILEEFSQRGSNTTSLNAIKGLTYKDAATGKDITTYDGVAVDKVYDALSSISVARQNPRIVEEIRKNLIASKGQTEGEKLFAEFMSGKIGKFEDLDSIKVATISATNEYERQKKSLQEEQIRIQSSRKTAEEKAAQDFNPNSGGK